MLFKVLFLFLAPTAILLSRAETFKQFWYRDVSSKEHFCEIILKSAYQPWWRCRFTGFSLFSSGGKYVEQGSEKLHQGNICIKLF